MSVTQAGRGNGHREMLVGNLWLQRWGDWRWGDLEGRHSLVSMWQILSTHQARHCALAQKTWDKRALHRASLMVTTGWMAEADTWREGWRGSGWWGEPVQRDRRAEHHTAHRREAKALCTEVEKGREVYTAVEPLECQAAESGLESVHDHRCYSQIHIGSI